MISGKLLADAYTDTKDHKSILKAYKHSTLGLRLKLYTKMKKRWVLCSPLLRHLIMKSGITSVEKDPHTVGIVDNTRNSFDYRAGANAR